MTMTEARIAPRPPRQRQIKKIRSGGASSSQPPDEPNYALEDGEDLMEVEDEPDLLEEQNLIGGDGKTKLASVKRKASGRRSEVWNHFTPYKDKKGLQRAKCNYCDCHYAAASVTNGTSSMRTHRGKCKDNPENINTNGANTLDNFVCSNEDGRELGFMTKWNHDDVRKSLAQMVIVDELPFKFVENPGFRNFCKVGMPQFCVPSRTTITRDCLELYMNEKNSLHSYFKEKKIRISLTTDTWTSNQNVNYMCLTGHFIDENWRLRKMILNFSPCDSHKGEDIGQLIEECLQEWGIEDVFTISVDNASSNDTAIAYLKRRFVLWKKDLLGGKYLHMRCVAHILNLVVKDGLKDVSISIERIRTAVKYTRNSVARWNRFKQLAKAEKISCTKRLILDVPTRWNSVYLMLERAISYKSVFERLSMRDVEFQRDFGEGGVYGQLGEPTKEDWEIAERLVEVLCHFYELTNRVSATKYVTSNIFLDEICDIYTLMKKWIVSSDKELCKFALQMKCKFDKYWGEPTKMNMLLYVVTVFDPRYKLKYVVLTLKDMYEGELGEKICFAAQQALYDMFDEYKKLYAPQAQETDGKMNESVIAEDGQRNSVRSERLEKFLKMSCEQGDMTGESELDVYLNEKLAKSDSNFDVINWWKQRSGYYPVLSRLARDLLAMPISTVASESAFSTGGRVIDDFRSSLSEGTIEALICTQDWLRTTPHISIEEDYESIETIEKDVLKRISKEIDAMRI